MISSALLRTRCLRPGKGITGVNTKGFWRARFQSSVSTAKENAGLPKSKAESVSTPSSATLTLERRGPLVMAKNAFGAVTNTLPRAPAPYIMITGIFVATDVLGQYVAGKEYDGWQTAKSTVAAFCAIPVIFFCTRWLHTLRLPLDRVPLRFQPPVETAAKTVIDLFTFYPAIIGLYLTVHAFSIRGVSEGTLMRDWRKKWEPFCAAYVNGMGIRAAVTALGLRYIPVTYRPVANGSAAFITQSITAFANSRGKKMEVEQQHAMALEEVQ
ncbi:hypothetical protein F4778DRAFT_727008 [Xylariomycetidae sp. FL2044]|nr:hypothetical protein F4778DRAFT_727008 [Xylariomycetidae sp. FL2044]